MFATWVTVVLCSSPELYPLFEKKKLRKKKRYEPYSLLFPPCTENCVPVQGFHTWASRLREPTKRVQQEGRDCSRKALRHC